MGPPAYGAQVIWLGLTAWLVSVAAATFIGWRREALFVGFIAGVFLGAFGAVAMLFVKDGPGLSGSGRSKVQRPTQPW